MAIVFIPPPMRDLTGGVDRVEVSAGSLRQVIRDLDARFPGIANRLCDGDRLARGLAVSVDGNLSTRGPLTRIGEQSEVHFLPAIGGG